MTQERITLLENKRIVLAVTGSIAAYKVADLASKLTQAGALVDVIMTDAAQQFVTPLTFQSVTGRPVYTDLWHSDGSALPTHIAHIGLAEGADVPVASQRGIVPGLQARRQVARQVVEADLLRRLGEELDQLPGLFLVLRSLEDRQARSSGQRDAGAVRAG